MLNLFPIITVTRAQNGYIGETLQYPSVAVGTRPRTPRADGPGRLFVVPQTDTQFPPLAIRKAKNFPQTITTKRVDFVSAPTLLREHKSANSPAPAGDD